MIFNEIWRLQRKHKKLTKFYAKQMKQISKEHSAEHADQILGDLGTEIDELSVDISIAQSEALTGEAYHLKLPIPSRNDKEAWDDFFGPTILTEKGYADLRSKIRQERKERRETLTAIVKDIISPLGALIISILSLLIAYAALKLKH